MFWRKKSERIYLDHAAATPVRPEVARAMLPFQAVDFGNPSAIHAEGQVGRRMVEEAREKVARTLRVRASEVYFTASGTESNNLAIYGLWRALRARHVEPADIEIISTQIEHPSVLEVLKDLESEGVTVHYAPVDEDGLIVVSALQKLLNEKTRLVTFAYANSEIGTVQSVRKISRVVKKYNQAHDTDIKIHLDAAQAPLWLPCELEALGVDMLALDAGKCCGPKGVGVLVVRHGVELAPVTLGGGQESGLRAGTENVSGIVGTALAIEIAQSDWEVRSERVAAIRDYGIGKLLEALPQAVLNGLDVLDGASAGHRIANNINISIPGIDSEFAVVTLDSKGVAASTKSACGGAGGDGSQVVQITSSDAARATSTIRLTLGEETTQTNLDTVAKIIKEFVDKNIL